MYSKPYKIREDAIAEESVLEKRFKDAWNGQKLNRLLNLDKMAEEILKKNIELRSKNVPFSERSKILDLDKLEKIAAKKKEWEKLQVSSTSVQQWVMDHIEATPEQIEYECLYFFELYCL